MFYNQTTVNCIHYRFNKIYCKGDLYMKKQISIIISLCLLLSTTSLVNAASLQKCKKTNIATETTSGANETFSFLMQKTLDPEYQNIIDVNRNNILTVEDIKNMSDEELEKYSLLPITDKEDDFATSVILNIDSEYSVTLWNYQQNNTYYCGPAATLNALATAGKYADVDGFSNVDKQKTLASTDYLCTDRDKGTWIEYVPTTLNHFDDRYRSWTCTSFDMSTHAKDSMEYWIRSNHTYGDQVIYLVKMSFLSYYPDSKTGSHYISGGGIIYDTGSTTDYGNIRLKLLDPNWDDTYYGTHIEYFDNVNEACYEYHKQVGPNSFVY